MIKEDRAAIMAIFTPVLGEELAADIIAKRAANKTVKPFCKYRAGLTLEVFLKSPDPKLAAWEYVNREANRKELTVEYLKACLSYDPDTGVFKRRIYRGHHSLPGTTEFGVGSHGYKETSLAGKLYLLHRLAWFYMTGEWPNAIDHIDRDKLNNRFGNLRECSIQENNWNLSMNRLNTSGVKGVSWDSKRGKWYASIRVGGRTVSLGRHDNISDAARAYESATSKHRGHFLEAAQ